MSYVLAFLGFAVLIILHEAGHFAAAKAVGMRVERFSLFFGPLLVKVRRGETEYGIGPIPLGGYVKITGMNPNEEIPPEVVPRAYYNQPVWKRIVVILAGPAVNLVLAFVIVWTLYLADGYVVASRQVATVQAATPAAAKLRPGDRLVSVDGVSRSPDAIRAQIRTHRCAGAPADGCLAASPARIVVNRDGRRLTFQLLPRYSKSARATLLGFAFGSRQAPAGPVKAASLGVSDLWFVTSKTVSAIAQIFKPAERRQLGSVVGAYTVTQKSFARDTTQAFFILAVISLSLAIINLFPFLPLDGGHVFWALAEKVRGRKIPFVVMERAGIVGFALILLLFAVGLSNDISTLSGQGFRVH
ncbi:MAG: M50 family metallopeptidase [Solirubrobacteraceae bacterium]